MAKRNHVTPEQWAAIRHSWEYDPDKPTYLQAAERAAKKHAFTAPSKSTVADRADREKWERKGSMAGVNAAAQRKADTLGDGPVVGGQPDGPDAASDGKPDTSGPKKAGAAASPSDPKLAQSAREDAEDLRASVLHRHREEWKQVAGLRQEALIKRPRMVNGVLVPGDVAKAFEAAKLAKITAEMTLIQQTGERKAWGLDVVIDPDQLKNLSDDDLANIAAGKAPGRR